MLISHRKYLTVKKSLSGRSFIAVFGVHSESRNWAVKMRNVMKRGQ